MQVLAAFNQKEILDTVGFTLESEFKAVVHRANSDSEGIQLLGSLKDKIDLVVIDGAAASTAAFAAFVKGSKVETPFLVCLKGQPKAPVKIDGINVLGVVDYTKLAADLGTYLSKINAKAPVDAESEDDKKYCRIGTNLLIKMGQLDAGVFIRLSANHYVQLFAKGDVFDVEDLKRYHTQKKIEYMYLVKDDTKAFLTKLNKSFDQLLKSKQVDVVKAEELVQESVDTVHELINQLGVTPEVEQLVSNNVAVSMKVMGDFPELKAVLNRMNIEKGKYIPSHSMMVAHLACAIAVAMDWYSDATFQKLTNAAFLHDVGLRDHDLCRVKTLQEFEGKLKGKYTVKQISEYKSHPQRGALMVQQFKELGPEVDKIIGLHHEHPLGTGFPNAVNSSHISPIASLFIVAHDIVDYAFDNDGKVDIEKYITENETKLQTPNFKKVLKGLMTMLPE